MIDWFVIAICVLILIAFACGTFIGASLTYKGARGINPVPLPLQKASLRLFGRKPAESEPTNPEQRWKA